MCVCDACACVVAVLRCSLCLCLSLSLFLSIYISIYIIIIIIYTHAQTAPWYRGTYPQAMPRSLYSTLSPRAQVQFHATNKLYMQQIPVAADRE